MKVILRPVSAVILGGGIIAAAGVGGHFAVTAVKASKTFNRVVTVKGISEREVKADQAIWPLKFKVAANSLPELQKEIENAKGAIVRFLLAQGFVVEEISCTQPKIEDYDANGSTREDSEKRVFRFSADATVMLCSAKADMVMTAMQKTGSLIRDGVALIGNDYETHPQFLFNGLPPLRAAMIEEATKDARAAANKFASDAQCGVGRIMRATQGAFEIDSRDPQRPQRKTVRVVTTVDFLLE